MKKSWGLIHEQTNKCAELCFQFRKSVAEQVQTDTPPSTPKQKCAPRKKLSKSRPQSKSTGPEREANLGQQADSDKISNTQVEKSAACESGKDTPDKPTTNVEGQIVNV